MKKETTKKISKKFSAKSPIPTNTLPTKKDSKSAKRSGKHRFPRPRIEPVQISHIVDCWRLFKSSTIHEPWEYPSLRNAHEDFVRGQLFEYIRNPSFFGMIMKIGKKPIAQVLSNLQVRMLGAPECYVYILNFWVEPDYRKRGYMKDFWFEFQKNCAAHFAEAKVQYWEGQSNDKLTEFLVNYSGYKTQKLYNRIGGRLY